MHKHKDIITVGKDKYMIGTSRDYALENGDDPDESEASDIAMGHPTVYAFSLGVTIHSGRYEIDVPIASYIYGDVINIKGNLYKIEPDYNHQIKLIKQ